MLKLGSNSSIDWPLCQMHFEPTRTDETITILRWENDVEDGVVRGEGCGAGR